MFTGEPTLAAGYAAGPTSLIALPPEDVRRVVATAPADLGDLLLEPWSPARDWLMGRGLGQQKLIGSRWSGEAFAVRELLERNLVPFTWHDLATDEEGRTLLEGLRVSEEECPVLVRSATSSGGRPSPRLRMSSGCGRRSTDRPSTWSCSAAARPGWPRPSTPPRRV